MAKLALVIPAAGSGERIRSSLPKPFIHIKEKPILYYTLARFAGLPELAEVVIASAPEYRELSEHIMEQAMPEGVRARWVEGGAERQYSIANALEATGEVDLVAVHDAVRPFVEVSVISACMRNALEHGASIVAVPAKDTIKETDESLNIKRTPDRTRLWHSQTPQIFRKELLQKAYRHAREHNIVGTDDSYLVECIGQAIRIVEGNRTNFKITYPFDLEVAELMIEKMRAADE